MDIRFLILTILLCFSTYFGAAQNPNDSIAKKEMQIIIPIYDSIVREYTVHKIKKIEKAYLIDVKDVDNYGFTIISLKCDKQKGEKIQKGKKYNLLLYSYYDPKTIFARGHGGLKRLVIGNITIVFKYDLITGIIVTTPNLTGLYYLKP